MLKIIIYNPNSFGGNFEYSKKLAEAYKRNKNVSYFQVWYPKNAPVSNLSEFKKFLLKDEVGSSLILFRKIYFVWRSLFNPFRLFWFLIRKKNINVIFNDFDQLTAAIWSPFFCLLKRRHCFTVILHDPDRDSYLPYLKLSQWLMIKVMKIMDIGLYHELLPERPYYNLPNLNLVKIPHGIYPLPKGNQALKTEIERQAAGKRILSIIGNIRAEKNYELIIDAISGSENCLLIAGKPASSAIKIEYLRNLAKKSQVEIIWLTRYLSDEDLAAAIESSEIILLYYKKSFTSQSGILNVIAPFKKPIIISDTTSALKELSVRFGLGTLVEADNKIAFKESLKENYLINSGQNWDKYLEYASWDNHVQIVIKTFQNKSHTSISVENN